MSIFDVPEFITMPAVGIDISTDMVRFIELKKKGKINIVSKHSAVAIQRGIVNAGSVQDPVAMSKIIEEMAKEHGFSFANVALPEEQSFLVQMDIPSVESQDIRSFIELHIEDYVPITATECIFDYTKIPSPTENVISVSVCVIPRKIVDQYLEIFNGTSVVPKTFELQSQSMARAIFPRDDSATYMGVDIGKDITNIFIIKNSVVQFSAIIDMGGDDITNEIKRSLNISFDEADAVKIKYGLINGPDNVDIRTPILSILEKLREEIIKYYSYWISKNSESSSIDRIYLTGGGANLIGIPEYFEQGISSHVLVSNPWINVIDFNQYTPPIQMNTARGYAAAIGLALKDL
jgi:type IV pilus assembly protein PilM